MTGMPCRGLSGALRHCIAVNKMPKAAVATFHQDWPIRATTARTIQKAKK
jgi:hypothetical protein